MIKEQSQKILSSLKLYFDDILFILGAVCLSIAGFLLHIIAGWSVLGILLIVYSIIVARGGTVK